jgi:hypothetical protein
MNKTEQMEPTDITRTEVAWGSKDSDVSFVNITGSQDTRPVTCYAVSTGQTFAVFSRDGCALTFRVKRYKKNRHQHSCVITKFPIMFPVQNTHN